jgi:Zn ribbon nucleic-acid-binding protein
MSPGELPRFAGGYRTAPPVVLACAPCALVVVSAGANGAVTRFRGSRAARKERAAGVACPHCGAQLLRLVLSMGDDSVAMEECNECGAAVVDRGELAALASIAAGLRDAR